MTPTQFKQMRQLIEEAIHLSPSPDFDRRANDFLQSVGTSIYQWDDWPLAEPVPVVIKEVIGQVQPIFGQRSTPLDDWVGGPG